MKECPAIIAALPREVKHLVRGWQVHKLPNKIIVYTNDFAVVACAGMGPARATLAVQAAMALKPVTALLSVGLAGACDPSLHVGDIVRAGVVVDTQSGERYNDSQFKQVLVSSPAIASVREKQRLHESYRRQRGRYGSSHRRSDRAGTQSRLSGDQGHLGRCHLRTAGACPFRDSRWPVS